MKKLKNLDRDTIRKIIYVCMFLAVIIPLLMPLGLPIKATKPVIDLFEKIESLPAGSRIALSFDYDPASEPEVHPMSLAVLRHCWSKNLKLIIIALWAPGSSLAIDAINEVMEDSEFDFKGKQYGVDYVNLGFVAGPTLGLTQVDALCSDLKSQCPGDINKTPIDDYEKLPIMRGVKSLRDVEMVISLSSGDPGIPAWVEIANARYAVTLAAGATAVQAPQFYPYIQSKQLLGFMGGLRGAAEYETLLKTHKLTKKNGRATIGMEAQSFAHLLIMILIIIANVTYLLELREEKKYRRTK